MQNTLTAVDAIYSNALQILSELNVSPQEIPLVMGTVTQRLDQFALYDMNRIIRELKTDDDVDDESSNQADNEQRNEVDNG